jgi:hypothetical protein
MPFYEIIYESGEHSIAFYENDDEAQSAIGAHVGRAKAGEPGSPQSTARTDLTPEESPIPVSQQRWAAQRVAKVLVYDEHPADYAEQASNISAEVAQKTAADCINEVKDTNGVVNIQQLAAALLETTAPRMLDDETGAHESNYKMKETKELKLKGGAE